MWRTPMSTLQEYSVTAQITKTSPLVTSGVRLDLLRVGVCSACGSVRVRVRVSVRVSVSVSVGV